MPKSTHKSRSALQVGNVQIAFDFPDNDLALFVSLGAALAEIQAFELSLLTKLGIFKGKAESKSIETIHEQNIDKTLGQLARLFTDVVKNDEIGSLLRNVRDKRNFIVHKILREYGWPMMSDDDYLKCYKEINDIREFIYHSEKELGKFLNIQQYPDAFVIEITPTGEIYIPGIDKKVDLSNLEDLFSQENSLNDPT